MTWTDEQWTTFCALLEEWWPGDFDAAARAAWRVALDGVTPVQASETAQRMLLSGHRFRPSVSEFLTEARRDPSRPTFDEAYRLIFGSRGALHALPATRVFGDADERARAEHQAILDRAGGMHPLIRAFIERQGINRLRGLPVDDLDWGEKHRRDLQAAWERHVEAFDGRQVAALAAGRPEDLRRLDPLASLGMGRAPELPAGQTT